MCVHFGSEVLWLDYMIISIESATNLDLSKLHTSESKIVPLPKPRSQVHSFRDIISEIAHWKKRSVPPGFNVIYEGSPYTLYQIHIRKCHLNDEITDLEYQSLVKHFERNPFKSPDVYLYVCHLQDIDHD